MLTRNNRLIIIGVILLILTSLMFLNVDKDYQYSVDELMESPDDFENDNVHLRGEVVIGIDDDEKNTFYNAYYSFLQINGAGCSTTTTTTNGST